MEENFWHERWENNNIGFHQSDAEPQLVEYFSKLSLEPNSRVFLPLCGKTLDISWLLSKGCKVVGAELNKSAIEQLFKELSITPTIKNIGDLDHYSADNIDIFVGNIFNVSKELLGNVDAIYDRAALVALPEDMRNEYTKHLIDITDKAPQLLICLEYDQSQMEGPPFSINSDKVKQHYANSYNLTFLGNKKMPDGLKGCDEVTEHAWLLT